MRFLCYILSDDFCSGALKVIQVSFGKLSADWNMPFTEERLLSDHSAMKALLGCTDSCPSVVQSSQRRTSGSH